MEVPEHRKWMYNRINLSTKWVTEEFEQGVDEFLAYVYQSPYSQKWGELRCPCVKCKSRYYLKFDEVKVHLYKKGFMPDYYVWTCHQSMSPIPGGLHSPQGAFENHLSQYETMVMDAAGPSFIDGFGSEDEHIGSSSTTPSVNSKLDPEMQIEMTQMEEEIASLKQQNNMIMSALQARGIHLPNLSNPAANDEAPLATYANEDTENDS